jgi:circadian clock protein KaiC
MALEKTDLGLSSLMDVWILLRDIEHGGERNRGIYVLKARGMAHSNQIREFFLTKNGIRLQEPYLGPEGVLTGSARVAQGERERIESELAQTELNRRRLLAERRRKALESQIRSLEAELEAEQLEIEQALAQDQARRHQAESFRNQMAISRRAGGAE